MKTMSEWTTYRTRFLVKAKQLNHTLSFTDALGRQHQGRKGDYLVESSDGVLRIAPRQIFEDIYVPMPPELLPKPSPEPYSEKLSRHGIGSPTFEIPAQLQRKYPQACRDRRSATAAVRFL